jgi:hypothetical protein
VQVVVLPIICCSDLGQQTCHHFDNVRDGHFADFILRASIGRVPTLSP